MLNEENQVRPRGDVGPNWFGRLRCDLAKTIRGIAGASLFFVNQTWWPLYAILVGIVPLLISFITGWQGHQLVSAIGLSFMCIGFVYHDRWVKCIFAITLVFVAHSILAIGISLNYPEVGAEIFPKAADYWARQHLWIATGENTEYKVSSWLPAHFQMAVGATLFSFTSFGTVVFRDGFVQVDVMNYYNAQLVGQSRNPAIAMVYGWHIWSIMRGVGFLFVTYEMISMAVQVFSRERLSSCKRRVFRWSLGLGFLCADGVIKFFSVEAVRHELFNNLL